MATSSPVRFNCWLDVTEIRSRDITTMSVNIFLLLVVVSYLGVSETTLFNNALDSPYRGLFTPTIGLRQGPNTFGSLGPFSANSLKRRCPICDSSVYGYCSEKLFHDSCCCSDPDDPYDRLPYQCQYADCGFLHANSCREHKLISACCCTNFHLLYRK